MTNTNDSGGIEVKHHYGWVNTKGKTPYKHIRETHSFLTDDNHTYEDKGDRIKIKRNQNSPEYHALTPEWAKNEWWFTCYYRLTNNN